MAKNQNNTNQQDVPEEKAVETTNPVYSPAPASSVAAGEYRTIHDWKKHHGTSDAIFSGTCYAEGWRNGKMVTDQEYQAAVKKFSGATMTGKVPGKKKEAKVSAT